MNEKREIRVFISSPSDTNEEREKISEIFSELNQTLGNSHQVYLRQIMWENDVRPTIGTDGQNVINSQTRDYDIFVGLMWKKFGNPTPRADSATEEEYLYALKMYREGGYCKDIIFMFSKQGFNIDDIDAEQIAKVKQFKIRVQQDGVLYKTYDTVGDFVKQLRISLYQSVVNLLGECQKDKIKEKKTKKVIPISEIDERTKLIFDTLSLSPAVNSVKTKFIESYILLYLFDTKQASSADINDYLCKTLGLANKKIYNTVLGSLNQTDSICRVEGEGLKLFSLSENKRHEITLLKQKDVQSIESTIHSCQAICQKYNIDIDVCEINVYVCNLFASSYGTDNGELLKGAVNREKCLKQMFDSLVQYICSETGLPIPYVEPIAEEIISAYSRNQYFYKSNISKMFLNLFHNEKLEEYLATTQRDLLLDTQVLLQICCVSFGEVDSLESDILYKVGKRFWDSVRSNDALINLYTTIGYVQEVAAHLKQAIDLSRFLSLDYIVDLGKSKNIFFNYYLSIKEEMEYHDFEDFVCDMLDIEYNDIYSSSFAEISICRLCEIFNDLSIEVLQHQDIGNYSSYKRVYENELSYEHITRSYEACKNDINAALIAGNKFDDFSNTPYLVTHDSIFMRIRDRFVEKFPEDIAFWNVFSPQKISEMLSLIHFKVDPLLVNENIISLTESNFNTSNDTISFLDLLNTIIDQKELGEWKLAAKLSKLRRLCKANISEMSVTTANIPIDEILSELINKSTIELRIHLSDIKELFCDNDYADSISELIQNELQYYKSGVTHVRDETILNLKKMVEDRKTRG